MRTGDDGTGDGDNGEISDVGNGDDGIADAPVNPAVNPADVEPAADNGGKRKRGRPRKSAVSDDGSNSGNDGRAAKPSRRPGRPSKADKATLDVPSLSLIVGFLSGGIAAMKKEPALKLDDDETRQVAEAVANVGQYYNVPISPVTQAWVALGMTVGGIYTGKFAAIKMKRVMSNDDAKAAPDMSRVLRPAAPIAAE